MKNLSIILPAYNESGSIEIIVKKIFFVLKKKKINSFKVIVVNDGSTDKTLDKCKVLKKKFKKFDYLDLKKNIGKAYAIDKGIENSNSNWICIIDADLQYDPNYLGIFLRKENSVYDFINSKRNKRNDSFFTIFGSNLYYFFLNFLFKKKYDYFSGLKVFKRKIYNELNYKGLVRFLIFYCIKNNLKIKEIPIKHKKRTYGNSYNVLQRSYLLLADIITIFFFIFFSKKQLANLELILLLILFIISGYYIIEFSYFSILIISSIIIIIYNLIKNKIFHDKKK